MEHFPILVNHETEPAFLKHCNRLTKIMQQYGGKTTLETLKGLVLIYDCMALNVRHMEKYPKLHKTVVDKYQAFSLLLRPWFHKRYLFLVERSAPKPEVHPLYVC